MSDVLIHEIQYCGFVGKCYFVPQQRSDHPEYPFIWVVEDENHFTIDSFPCDFDFLFSTKDRIKYIVDKTIQEELSKFKQEYLGYKIICDFDPMDKSYYVLIRDNKNYPRKAFICKKDEILDKIELAKLWIDEKS